MNPELESRIANLRVIAATRDLTREEQREVVEALRQGRLSAHHASDTARKRTAKTEIPNANDLLGELEGM